MLFGDDGSSCADSAWLWVNSHDWPGWSIEVLAAVDSPGSGEPPSPRTLLRPEVADSLTNDVVHADPRFALHTRAPEVDLLVVGDKGRGLLKAMHLGSTAEWLMNDPAAPLVIVRGGHQTRRVLLAHDGSRDAQAAEDALLTLPWIMSAEVLVVSVSDHETNADPVVAAAIARLADRVGTVTAQILAPDELQVFYRPRDLILDHCKQWHADLIVMGSRGVGAWESVNEVGLRRAGSTASAIARHAPCSVLLAKARS
ncbi:MAG: universal stress protein [Candidatus Nanopelagicales bacterium]